MDVEREPVKVENVKVKYGHRVSWGWVDTERVGVCYNGREV